jgi:hypothetical protein
MVGFRLNFFLYQRKKGVLMNLALKACSKIALWVYNIIGRRAITSSVSKSQVQSKTKRCLLRQSMVRWIVYSH